MWVKMFHIFVCLCICCKYYHDIMMLNSFHQAAEVERLRFMLHEQVPFLDNFLLIWSSIDANHNWYQSKLKHDIENHEKKSNLIIKIRFWSRRVLPSWRHFPRGPNPNQSKCSWPSLTTDWLFYSLLWIQILPGKTQPRKTDGGHEKTWPDQQKDKDKII